MFTFYQVLWVGSLLVSSSSSWTRNEWRKPRNLNIFWSVCSEVSIYLATYKYNTSSLICALHPIFWGCQHYFIRSKIVGYGDWASAGKRWSQWWRYGVLQMDIFHEREEELWTWRTWVGRMPCFGISFASWAPPKQASPPFSIFSNMKTTCIWDPNPASLSVILGEDLSFPLGYSLYSSLCDFGFYFASCIV